VAGGRGTYPTCSIDEERAMIPTATETRPGLRERKKQRTRDHIRETALRLFADQGYEATTVQQVAEAADVSLSTLFRYFPTKAQLVLRVDLSTLVRDAFRDAGPGDSVFDAIEAALRASFPELAATGPAGAPGDAHAVTTLARARDALLGEATGAVGLYAELIAEHWGRDPHDPLVQAASGAVVGVGMAAWSADRDLGRAAALRILHVGMQGLEEAFRP
jgi:AcrR family transcriptional regulator